MKKIFAIMLILIMVLSMCACTGTYIDEAGEEHKVSDGEIVLDVTDDFVITRIDKSDYATKSSGQISVYTITLKDEEHAIVIEAKAKQYALWEVGDIIHGNLIAKYSYGYDHPIAKFEIDDDTTFRVEWYGKIE